MSQPDDPRSTPGPLARRDGEPAFDEPWQAQVMGLAFTLMERGAFDNVAWSDALGAALADATGRGEPDDASTYYRAALTALETLMAGADRVRTTDLDARTEAWRRAYLNTPHGQPVELAAGERGPAPRAPSA
ncbi:MAG: nitrile hydratase accessory protein [Ectothiorhodospiraceae bacterium]|nr:nitrile hydratase accessory protein [Ectothiorhodospiraceae bacterium]